MIKQAFLSLSFLQHAVFSKEGTVISLLKKQKSGTLVIFRLLLRGKNIFSIAVVKSKKWKSYGCDAYSIIKNSS